jgi:serine protease Do
MDPVNPKQYMGLTMNQRYFPFPSKILVIALFIAQFFVSASLLAKENLPDFSQIVANSGKSVVNILTINKERKKLVPDDLRADLEGTPLMDVLKQMFGDKLEENLSGKGPGLGSGSIISADGYIVTNAHVIEGASKIIVRLQDRREFVAKVIGKDTGTDLALIKISAKDLPALAYADSNLVKVGEWVLAIGSPYGFENTVTVGVVSATGRSLGSERYVPFIQSDVAINPGNSGGPLLNLQGEMLGINSQIISESGSFAGLSFAVPSNVIKTVIEQLKTNGSVARGWLGLAFQDLDGNLAESFGLNSAKGALISQVIPNSPAAKAGLREGDIVTQFNGKEIIKATDLPPIVGLLPVDSKVPLTLVRNKKEMNVSVVLTKYVESEDKAVAKSEPKLSRLDKMHQEISVRNLEEFDQPDLGSKQGGVKVTSIRSEFWVAAGIRKGDVIVAVDSKPIANEKEFYIALREADNDHAIHILVNRSGDVQKYLAVKLQ